MRTVRILGAVVVAVAVAGLVPATPATAGRPTRVVNTVDELSCVFSTTTGDSVFIQASASSDTGESGSSFFVEDEDLRTILQGSAGTAVFGPRFSAVVTATVPDTGEVVGTVSLTADLVPGEPVVEQVDQRDGNVRTRGTVTTSEFSLTDVSVEVPGFSALPAELACSGSRIDFDLVTTNPPAQVTRIRTFGSETCPVTGIPGAEVRLSGERGAPFAELVIADDTNPLKAQGTVLLRGGRGTLQTPLEEILTGERVADLTLRLALSRSSAPTTTVERDGRALAVRIRTPYQARIEVSSTDGRLGQVVCAAEDVLESAVTPRR